MSAWQWPQWVEAGLLVMGTVVAVSHHGKAKGDHNGPASFIGAAFIAWLLWCGGFWG